MHERNYCCIYASFGQLSFFFFFFFLLRDIIIAFIIFGPWQMINWNAINYMYYFIVRWLLNFFNVDVIPK